VYLKLKKGGKIFASHRNLVKDAMKMRITCQSAGGHLRWSNWLVFRRGYFYIYVWWEADRG